MLYQIGFAAERGGEEPPPFDVVAESFDRQVEYICQQIESDMPPILFLTGKGNFRNVIAKRQKYKERTGNKPFHYYNLKAYVKGKYDYRCVDGLEADDLLAIEATRRTEEVCICSVDKDLRAVRGWHYTWEVGARPAIDKYFVEGFGELRLSSDRKSAKGNGLLFFLCQVLTGDTIDSIIGLPKCGAVKAVEALEHCQTYEEGLRIVYKMYREVYGRSAKEEMLEQGRLLWMTRELNEDGIPVLWDFDAPV